MEHFSQYIKQIGRGKTAGNYLTYEQASAAMHQLLTGHVEPEQVGAFLMLLRFREESIDELAGFLIAARKTIAPEWQQQLAANIDVACYAGKRRHQFWSLLSWLVLAQNGYKIFIHGSQESESSRFHIKSLFQSLDLPIANSPLQASDDLKQYGLCYVDLKHFCPALEVLMQYRSLFGLRSCANSLARMLNPTAAQLSIKGVHHRGFEIQHIKVASALQEKHQLLCFRGDGGETEVNPERPFDLWKFDKGLETLQVWPALLEKKVIKPRELNTQSLIDFWCGETEDHYGHSAVVGTLAVALTHLEKLSIEQALVRANTLWNQRDIASLLSGVTPIRNQIRLA